MSLDIKFIISEETAGSVAPASGAASAVAGQGGPATSRSASGGGNGSRGGGRSNNADPTDDGLRVLSRLPIIGGLVAQVRANTDTVRQILAWSQGQALSARSGAPTTARSAALAPPIGGAVANAAGNAGQAAGAGQAGAAGGISGGAALALKLGVAAVVVGGAILAVKKLTDVATRLSTDLAPYSGALAAAQARAQVRKLEADVRSAQQLGEALAKFTDSQSKIETSIQAMRDTIASVALDIFNPAFDKIADAFAVIEDLLRKGQAVDSSLDIFGLFGDLPPLEIRFGGDIFTPRGGRVVPAGAEFNGPLPELGL